MTSIRIGAAAKRDLAEAKAWYADQASGLDRRFMEAFEAVIRD